MLTSRRRTHAALFAQAALLGASAVACSGVSLDDIPGSFGADAGSSGNGASGGGSGAGDTFPAGGSDAGGLVDATLPSGGGGAGDGGSSSDAATAPPADAAPAHDSGPTCPVGPPSLTTAPPTVDVSCFTSTFDDDFTTYDISSGAVDDGQHPNEKWFNGIEQCCLAPSDTSQGTAMYPTVLPNGPAAPVNPFSLLDGGGLQIRLQLIDNDWFSGVMTSVDKNNQGFTQQYGYFEFDAKMPKGTGTWPALWFLSSPPGSPGGELDLLEQYGGNNPPDPGADTSFVITFHDWVHNTGVQQIARGLPDLTDAMHRYGLLWNTTYLAVYFDGALLWSTPTIDVWRKPYYLLADMGLGSGWDTSQTPSPSDFQIKYIRAYTVPGF